jgi:HEAT repeat protein
MTVRRFKSSRGTNRPVQRRSRGVWLRCVAATIAMLMARPLLAADLPIGARDVQDVIDNPMYSDPAIFPPPVVPEFDSKIGDLLLAALDRPDIQTRRQACSAWAAAWRQGAPKNRAALARLIVLTRDSEDILRRSAADALVAADDPSAGPAIVALLPTADAELLHVVAPAIVHWKLTAAVAPLAARIGTGSPSADGIGVQIAALQILADLPAGMLNQSDIPAVASTLLTDQSANPALRLAAAKTLSAGQHDAAVQTLLASSLTLDHLIAATLLQRGDDTAALLRLAQDPEPAVRSLAVARLVADFPTSIGPLDTTLVADSDDTVRGALPRAYIAQANAAVIPNLITLLNDPIYAVRAAARQGLITLDTHSDLSPAVRQALRSTLTSPTGWHAAAEAATVAGALHADEMLTLLLAQLDDPDARVRCAAARAIGHLPKDNSGATVDPTYQAAAPVMFTHAQTIFAGKGQRVANGETTYDDDNELAALLQSLAILHDAEIIPLCRELIPKGVPFGNARVAAIWALGKVIGKQGAPDSEGELFGRVTDKDEMHPELSEVQFMSAITIGRFHDAGAVDQLRAGMIDPHLMGSTAAMRWAIGEITGTPQPPMAPNQHIIGGFFLDPLNP